MNEEEKLTRQEIAKLSEEIESRLHFVAATFRLPFAQGFQFQVTFSGSNDRLVILLLSRATLFTFLKEVDKAIADTEWAIQIMKELQEK